jgi:hypothetical protein
VGDFTNRDIYYKIFLKTKHSKLSLPLIEALHEEEAISIAQELAEPIEVDLKFSI